MANAPTYLANFQQVVEIFGYWPDFHDSPVIRFQDDSLAIELEVETWETTDEIDDRGFLILRRRHIIGFRFEDLIEKDLHHFLHANILFQLVFSSEKEYLASGRFSVTLDSAMGSDLCGWFLAKKGEVTFVRGSEEG